MSHAEAQSCALRQPAIHFWWQRLMQLTAKAGFPYKPGTGLKKPLNKFARKN
jgi:hypothetical protein